MNNIRAAYGTRPDGEAAGILSIWGGVPAAAFCADCG